jgi:hypothetical protein
MGEEQLYAMVLLNRLRTTELNLGSGMGLQRLSSVSPGMVLRLVHDHFIPNPSKS